PSVTRPNDKRRTTAACNRIVSYLDVARRSNDDSATPSIVNVVAADDDVEAVDTGTRMRTDLNARVARAFDVESFDDDVVTSIDDDPVVGIRRVWRHDDHRTRRIAGQLTGDVRV